MKKVNFKNVASKISERIARESVGKSCPWCFYEPKVPASLKEQIRKECK